jgi:lipopolysaccharide biosynthesis protein
VALQAIQLVPPQQAVVFVGPWNSIYGHPRLEPDMLNGYAYLEATRQALRFASRRRSPSARVKARIAVVVHAFYIDILEEMMLMLQQSKLEFDIFATCPRWLYDQVKSILHTFSCGEVLIETVENRGRDVSAFLYVLPVVVARNYDVVLKLHTKRSLHRQDGDLWRKDIYHKLMGQERSNLCLKILRGASGYGILGPEGSLLPMEHYGRNNIAKARALGEMMGFISIQERGDVFVAGTMFYARADALRPLLGLGLKFENFEPETGQIDGTLAHVMERAISYSALAAGYRVGEVAMTTNGLIARVPNAGRAPQVDADAI